LAQVHESRDLYQHHLALRERIPITSPARTVVDLAATAHPKRVERILDAAWSRRLLNIGELADIVFEVRGRGRSGVRLLDELIEARKKMPRPGSALEMRYVDVLQRHGLPTMRRQVHLSDEEGWIGCVDFVANDNPLVVFIDGAAWHTSLTDRRHDDRQTTRIRALGYEVARFSDAQVLFEEDAIVTTLRPLLVPARFSAPMGAEKRARTEGEAARPAA
jgi:very-short-patch-repair endonuclease